MANLTLSSYRLVVRANARKYQVALTNVLRERHTTLPNRVDVTNWTGADWRRMRDFVRDGGTL